MARSREVALRRLIHARSLARDQADLPEGQTAQLRADAIAAEHRITEEEIAKAEGGGKIARRTVFWRTVVLYPGLTGGPAAWQIALVEWASARYGGGGGYVAGQPCVLAYSAADLECAVRALQIASEALLSVASQLQQGGLGGRSAWGNGTPQSVRLPQDVVGWIFACVLADLDAPAPPPSPPAAPPTGAPRTGAPTPTAPRAASSAGPPTALAHRPPPWSRERAPDACVGIESPQVPEQLSGVLLDALTLTANRTLACLPVRSASPG